VSILQDDFPQRLIIIVIAGCMWYGVKHSRYFTVTWQIKDSAVLVHALETECRDNLNCRELSQQQRRLLELICVIRSETDPKTKSVTLSTYVKRHADVLPSFVQTKQKDMCLYYRHCVNMQIAQ